MDSKNKPVYIILGTRAQFIKVAPLMRKMLDRGLPYTLIYTAQHRENIQEMLSYYGLPEPNIVLYDREEANNKSSFIRWFRSILAIAIFQAKKYIPVPGILLTHGDTFTAWLGALMGKRSGCLVGHIESGCRSFNILSPFPEELSRLITFRLSDIYFCADEWAVNNLRSYKGRKINMGANTMLDGVRYALEHPQETSFAFQRSRYALVSIHRFENIFTPRFEKIIIPLIEEISQEHYLVFTLHPTTRERLHALDLYGRLSSHKNILLHERFGFADWINVCNQSNFVITDGGSNQEELSYLGVPTLLLRNETERREGLGENVLISHFDTVIIADFMKSIDRYKRNPQIDIASPSESIIHCICKEDL